MIELDFQPVVRGMTIAALCAERSGVRIIVLMAREAVAGCVAMALLGLMAIIALVALMLAQQREVADFVIERPLVEVHDIRIATFVVSMAIGADAPARSTVFAVKPGLCFDIPGNLLMAVEAKCTLLAAFKAHMAIGALFLVLGMGFHDLARHDQCFDLCACWTGKSQCQSHQESE